MRRMTVAGLLLLAPAILMAQTAEPPAPKAPLGNAPKVEMKGTIEKVQIANGQGTPFLEMKTEQGVRRVMLGSMRYLMEKNFNPKAGEPAQVKGFQMNDDVMAQVITLPQQNVTLALRDENGMPLWRGGNRGGKQYRYGQK